MAPDPSPLSFRDTEPEAPLDTRPRLVICDDERIVSYALRRALEPQFLVIEAVASGPDLMGFLSGTAVDCVLLEVGITNPSGLVLLKDLRARHPEVKVLVLTIYADRIIAEACMSAGASGFVPKQAPSEELQEALRVVLGGGSFLSRTLPKSIHSVGLRGAHIGLRSLTRREQDVFELMGQGARQTEIAERLGISRAAVSLHVRGVSRKLGFASTAALGAYAVLVSASLGDSAH